MNRVVFLDRDGVINKEKGNEYITSWAEFVFQPGVLTSLRQLTHAGIKIIVITNQSCIGRGIVSREAVEEIHQEMILTAAQHGGKIFAVYFCPHRPEDRCSCRKPEPGLLLRAAKDLSLELKGSYLIGNSLSDIAAGTQVGCTTFLIADGYKNNPVEIEPKIKPAFVVTELSQAVNIILTKEGSLP